MQATKEQLLNIAVWDGLGFVGDWQPLSGNRTVSEPATGAALGRIGIGNAADITRDASSPHRSSRLDGIIV